jgi:hypothetical protein
MPQIFHRGFNTLSKVTIYGAVFLLAALGYAVSLFVRSSYATNAGLVRNQPVPFSHQHHVNELGIDCRYCHTSVEDSAFAGIPPTKTCMNCHSQIWVGADMLAAVRQSYRTDQSIPWQRVHRLGEFCYFNHSIHINKGIGCVSCHGRVDRMPLVRQVNTLLMEWCLDCHRAPENHVRPRKEVFNMAYERKDPNEGKELVKKYNIRSKLSCNTCHR